MSALSSFPTAKRFSPNGSRRGTLPAHGGRYADRLIAEMHSVLSDPYVAPGVARAAKRSLLLALERNKGRRRPQLVVPPLPNGSRKRKPRRPAREGETEPGACAICGLPLLTGRSLSKLSPNGASPATELRREPRKRVAETKPARDPDPILPARCVERWENEGGKYL